MKATMTFAFIAMMTILSASVHAIPPVPPTPAQDEPAMIVCKDANALTESEIKELDADSDKIVSFDQELREICFYK